MKSVISNQLFVLGIRLSGSLNGEEGTKQFVPLLEKYKVVISAVTIALLLSCVALIVYFAVKMAGNGDKSPERQKAVHGIIYTLIATALIGSAWGVISLFAGMF